MGGGGGKSPCVDNDSHNSLNVVFVCHSRWMHLSDQSH